ncbi:hypothetical protein H7H51_07485 [Mycolicibacterium farcinogenes]|nr:hypothetical protein [Mycolicibacterium farcinogenes]
MDFSFDAMPRRSSLDWQPSLVGDLFASRDLCGRSMNHGLLRFHSAESGPAGQDFVDQVYGRRGLPADVFAFDWLARQYAVTSRMTPEGEPDTTDSSRTVVVLDPFDLSVTPWVELPSFEQALGVPLAEQFLDVPFFREWLTSLGIDSLPFDSCAGFDVPAFYGGGRELGNLTLDSNEVYLSFVQQLWEQKLASPPSAPAPCLVEAEE